MKRGNPVDVGASVRHRLLDLSRKRGEDFNLTLTRYALERLLYRLSLSEYRDQFILKGAMLFSIWGGEPHRPTRDIDLHGSGESSVDGLVSIFRDISSLRVEDDGLEFKPETVNGMEIREDLEYEGVRINMEAHLSGARISLQVDIGFGDAVLPEPDESDFPTILDFPAPHLLIYPRETVVAEKYQAMVMLGIANSRMKDFYDIKVMAETFLFDGETLSRAIGATFERRRTAIPKDAPLVFRSEFYNDAGKQTQWKAFIGKNRLTKQDAPFAEVISFLAEFLMPPTIAAAKKEPLGLNWPPSGPWE